MSMLFVSLHLNETLVLGDRVAVREWARAN